MKLRLIFIALISFTSTCSEGSNQALDSQVSNSGFSSQKELEKAAQKGDSKALFILASSYATNSDSFDDQKKAFHLFEQAANLGNDEAMLQLGLLYQDGSSYVKEIDNQKALLWYKRAAEKIISLLYIMLVLLTMMVWELLRIRVKRINISRKQQN